jgi:aerobic-type carbon monoxide dehydrogenase small subunit (CoxS/CutS family)
MAGELTLRVVVNFVQNGSEVSGSDTHPHLLAVLPEKLDVCSPNDGCSRSGQYGCAVLVDRRDIASCNVSLAKIADTMVTTLEGMPDDQRQRLACAFAA